MNTYQALIATVKQHTGSDLTAYPSEITEDYLKRLAKAVSEVTKKLFDAMPEQAQIWFDNAATAMAEKMSVPLPEGFDPDNPVAGKPPAPAPRRIPRPTGSAVPRVPIPRPQAPKPAPQQTAPEPQPAPAANEPPVDETVQTTIARMLVANESLSLDQLTKELQTKGVRANKATVRHNRFNTLTILRLLREAGWQPPP